MFRNHFGMIRIGSCLVALAALAMVAAGCGGGGNSGSSVSACTVPAGMQYALVYPVPSSTGNPTSLSAVVVATSGTLPPTWMTGNGWDIELNYSATGSYPGTALGGEFAAVSYSAIPTPNATPSFANPSYYQSTFSYASNANTPLPPGTVITATLNNLNSNCYPGVTIGTFGT
jgi:hypothetical protein